MSAVSLTVPIRNEMDILGAASRAAALAGSAGCSPADRTRVLLAALHCASEACSQGADMTLSVPEQPEAPALFIGAAGRQFEFALPHLPESVDAVFNPALLLEQFTEHLSRQDKMFQNAQRQVIAVQEEMEETNRGVLALYAELDDRAEKLRRADELKSRFLSYASHELRTPLNGIVGLVRLLNNRSVTREPEEQKQLSFILRSAEEMREMVNDLLDLAKVEAGKVTIQPSQFGLDFVFGALRGIFRPLLQTDDVMLYFDDTTAVPSIYSDEAKVSQILRNLISNALKFTEHGEVRVWASVEGDMVRISVRDTGIGIAPEHLSRIFEEYAQIEHPLQRRVRGTGLGLPLCRRMSSLLGGHIEVESELGKGSVFSLVLPLKFETSAAVGDLIFAPAVPVRSQPRVLLIDQAEIDRYLVGQLIRAGGPWEILHAGDGYAGLEMARTERPDLIVLDLAVPRVEASAILSELRSNPRTSRIPVIAVTSRKIAAEDRPAIESGTVAIFTKDKLADARRMVIRFGPPVSVDLFNN